jgi:hypothetical protein
MKVQKGHVEDEAVVVDSSINIEQHSLSSDCWPIQFYGLTACKDCELEGTPRCGGGETLKRLKEGV